jgi:hypothetical protein
VCEGLGFIQFSNDVKWLLLQASSAAVARFPIVVAFLLVVVAVAVKKFLVQIPHHGLMPFTLSQFGLGMERRAVDDSCIFNP